MIKTIIKQTEEKMHKATEVVRQELEDGTPRTKPEPLDDESKIEKQG